MLDLAQYLAAIDGFGKLAATLAIAGGGMIAANVLTHRWIEHSKGKRADRRKVERRAKPLLRATAELISRITELLITHNPELLQAVRNYDQDNLADQISKLTPASLTRLESTAFRLVNFLALAKYFERQTVDVPAFPLLDRIEYFLQHKIAVGLRGNLYDCKMLGTELQEEIGTRFLECERDRSAVELTVGTFVRALREKTYDSELFRAALTVFDLDPPTTHIETGIDRKSKTWCHTLNLAHLAIYLIDFYQELERDPQWEEHRIFFVKLVKQWNADSTKHRHLYEYGDMETRNYVDTFPAKRTSSQSSGRLARAVPSMFGQHSPLARMWMQYKLNKRGARFGRRHHPKEIFPWGVRIRVGSQNYDIRLNKDLQTVYNSVRAYSRERLLHLREG